METKASFLMTDAHNMSDEIENDPQTIDLVAIITKYNKQIAIGSVVTLSVIFILIIVLLSSVSSLS